MPWLGPHLRQRAGSACRAARTCASTRASPAGTSTGAMPSTPWSTRPTPTRCPRSSATKRSLRLLCAGIIGYRALLRANLPEGGRLGIYGFGGSAHITAQVALAHGARVHVMTRSPEAQALALRARGHQRRGCRRRAARAPRLGHPVRPGRHAGAAGAGRARPRRDARHRGHLSQRHPRPQLPGPPLRGADPAERDRQHPARRGGVPGRGGPHPACAWRPRPTPWTAPTPRCATSATTASTAPPSWSPEPGPSALCGHPGGGQNDRMTTTTPLRLARLRSGAAVAARREELGLSVEELASQAGIDPGYLAYFESSPDANLSGGTLLLLALALDTSPFELLGGAVDRPPGHAPAVPHAELRRAHPRAVPHPPLGRRGGPARVLLGPWTGGPAGQLTSSPRTRSSSAPTTPRRRPSAPARRSASRSTGSTRR